MKYHITAGTNAEIDLYGCLVDKLETKVNCRLERDLLDFQANATAAKAGHCLDFGPVAKEVLGQEEWLEPELVAAGCVPSCRREIFAVSEMSHEFMDKEEYIGYARDPGAIRKLRYQHAVRSFVRLLKSCQSESV